MAGRHPCVCTATVTFWRPGSRSISGRCCDAALCLNHSIPHYHVSAQQQEACFRRRRSVLSPAQHSVHAHPDFRHSHDTFHRKIPTTTDRAYFSFGTCSVQLSHPLSDPGVSKISLRRACDEVGKGRDPASEEERGRLLRQRRAPSGDPCLRAMPVKEDKMLVTYCISPLEGA